MNTELFSRRLRNARQRAGLSQKDLAAQLGLDRSSIAAYENGHNTPTLDRTVALADALDVSLDWLTGRSDAPPKGGESGDR